ncbi:uncharacterized protein LOC109855165 [Pseudomyrmex gracilis]|uniref:uncharacterized protein LOC109855165 n=1 Tax=Pseudomyrmex gracilis TaxID=219809 RepID=UPI0009950FDA|nr:uncharacterized protein LOC109855165 [Pseudomyrmex gracilis]
MIAATKACGCPQSRLSLVARAKRSCSLSDERFSCCAKSSRCAPSCSGHVPSTTLSVASKESVGKQSSRDKSMKHGASSAERIPTKKIVSEIVRKKQPYKEIEAVINDNRVIIRMHKEREDKEEYEPPCECVDQEVTSKDSTSSLKQCDKNGVAFEMANGTLEIHRASREDATETICDRERCRAVTLYPNVKDNDSKSSQVVASERDEHDKSREQLDREENPNIFVLRIRKRSDIGDKKQKIDLEFRTPRPWRSTKDKRKELSTVRSEKSEET